MRWPSKGMSAGKLQRGIYQVEGKTLKICIAAAGLERPTDFTSVAGDLRTTAVWSLKKASI
ncbi:MAG: hypothetical protein M3N54_15160 [Acidobacteriota bacterium]|nr:hypothetical protein [Acidobacteriota bacterium]